jgi:hypothetical protein
MLFAVNGKTDYKNFNKSEENVELWIEEIQFEFLEDINKEIRSELKSLTLPGVFECDFYPPDDDPGQDIIFENFKQLWPKRWFSLSHTPLKNNSLISQIYRFVLRAVGRWKGFFKKKQ